VAGWGKNFQSQTAEKSSPIRIHHFLQDWWLFVSYVGHIRHSGGFNLYINILFVKQKTKLINLCLLYSGSNIID